MGSSRFLLAAMAMQHQRIKRRRRQRRRAMQSDSKIWVAPEIPLELVIEIMSRLPAKCVMRFKCLSKFWSSIFSSRYYCNRFLMAPSRPQPRLYMSLLNRWDYSKSLLLSSAPTTSPSSLVFDKDQTVREMGGSCVRTLRGFICFTVGLQARIYNPSTKQLIILPAIETDFTAEKDFLNTFHYLGHDPANDQYKLLCTFATASNDIQNIRSEHWVYILEAGGSWKRVAKEFHNHVPHPYELTMDGFIYYLALISLDVWVLVSFDVRSEEFNMIQLPRKAGYGVPRLRKRLNQINYQGKVAVFDFTFLKETGKVDLWIVQDWRKKEWSRKTLVLPPSQMHLVVDNNLVPKGTSLKDKVILVPRRLVFPFYFLCYDLHSNDLKRVEIKGIPNRWFSKCVTTKYFDLEFMNPGESVMYLES